MKTRAFATLAAILSLAAVLVSCGTGNATVSFSITDSPVDSSTVKAVNLTVSSVAVNESGTAADTASSWNTVTISQPLTVNLLDLQGGVTAALGENLSIAGGTQINQIRLGVDSVSITESDDSVHTATLPSATGFKIVNAFDVPLSGNIGITIDFDVRKAIVQNAGGYTVKPAIRAVISGEAGDITGSVGTTAAVAVYAYATGTYTDAEAVATADGVTFGNAYSSALVGDTGNYHLAFMDPGSYDLYAVDASGAVVGTPLTGVTVTSGDMTANQDF